MVISVAHKPVQSKTDGQDQPDNGSADNEHGTDSEPQLKSGSLPFWRVMISVFQAAFGVQSQGNKERDFAEGKLLPFIVAALLFTAVFVGVLVLVVSLVLG